MTENIEEALSQNRQSTLREIKQVRESEHLSDVGKAQVITEKFNKGHERHQALVERLEADEEKARTDLHHDLFTSKFTISQPDYARDQIRRNFRMNLQEADKILTEGMEETGGYNVAGLQRYLEMSLLCGGREAARAAFSLAHERGITEVTERYLQAFPDARPAYEEYRERDRRPRHATGGDMIERSFKTGWIPRPPELGRDRDGDNAVAQIFGRG